MKKRAAIYARCSTERQDQSIEDQIKAIEPYAATNGYEIVVAPYIDEGYSGTDSVGRPAFMRMMDLIESGRANFDFILCYDTTRWSRSTNPNEARGWEFLCNRHNVQVEYTNESFGNERNLSNDLTRGLKQAMASEDSRKLSKFVTRGMKSRARKGFRLSHAPYGYKRAEADPSGKVLHDLPLGHRIGIFGNHAVLVPGDLRQIEVVKRIFRMYLNGLGIRKIARKLNSEKIPPARGRLWCGEMILSILKNEVYIGTQIFGKNRRGPISVADNTWGDTDSVRYRHDRKNWIIIPDNHPAIIDQDTFDRVQKELKEKAFFKDVRPGRPYGSRYLLHGPLTCGKCGGKFVGGSHRRKDGHSYVFQYHCLSHLRHGKDVCDASAFMRERPDDFVIDKITQDLNNPTFRKLVKEKLRARLIVELANKRTQKDIKRDIDTCERSIATLLTRIEDDECDNWELINKRLAKRREDLERLKTELRQYQEVIQDQTFVETVISDLDKRFLESADYLSDKTVEDDELNEIKKKIIKQFLYKGVVSPDGSQITFYFYQTPVLDAGMVRPAETDALSLDQDTSNRQETDGSKGPVKDPEDYRVEILRLQEDVYSVDGETWYTYAAYAKMKEIGNKLVGERARRGLLARKFFFSRPYVRDKDEVETIVENGITWYTYFAYAKLHGVTYNTVGSEAARGTLEKKVFNGKPYVRKIEIPDSVEENGVTWYRYRAFAYLIETSPDVIENKARNGRIERKYFAGIPYVSDAERGDTIVENGRTWYRYGTYAEQMGVRVSIIEYRARRGTLDRKYFHGKPYVSDKVVDNIVEETAHVSA